MSAYLSARDLREQALETAVSIGERIVREAVWYRRRCNWIGAEPEERPPGSGIVYPSYVALDCDLYGGTAGIGLFLAELHAYSGDSATREAALGALRHAVSRVSALPPPVRVALYSGRVGVALAAARAGALLDVPELRERAVRLASFPRGGATSSEHFDLVSGTAGTIVGLLALGRELAEEAPVERAAVLGDVLLSRARRTEAGYSWASPTAQSRHDLTGLSHGAAGAGYALVELYRVTSDDRFRAAADEAFRYERSWFDERVGNWPDLRGMRAARTRAQRPSFATLWCHGAPGIALSRLRAYELLGDPAYRAEAEVGVATTRRAVEAWLAAGGANFSLCHGLAGNAEVLADASRALGDGIPGSELASRVALHGIERYAAHGAWPCGIPEGPTPNLFLGFAGIGRFYLRLFEPTLPSLLLVRPEAFARDAASP